MSRLMIIGLFASLSACIVYEEVPVRGQGGHHNDSGDCSAEVDSPCSDPDLEEEEDAWLFELDLQPPEAEQGDVFVATLTADGDLDLSEVTDLHVSGDIEVLVTVVREGETMLVMEVDADAQLGEADLVLELADGTVVVFDAALSIFAADTGHSAMIEECP